MIMAGSIISIMNPITAGILTRAAAMAPRMGRDAFSQVKKSFESLRST